MEKRIETGRLKMSDKFPTALFNLTKEERKSREKYLKTLPPLQEDLIGFESTSNAISRLQLKPIEDDLDIEEVKRYIEKHFLKEEENIIPASRTEIGPYRAFRKSYFPVTAIGISLGL
jgi:hypothetical protein